MTDEISYTSQDGLSLHARSYGPEDAKVTALCMHGLTRNHKDFEPMIGALGATHRFIAVDVRGRGRSQYDSKPENYSPSVYAEDMRALLNHLQIEKVALIGTSMGGLMAMIMNHTMPERLLGTVLNDVGPQLNIAGLRRISSYVGPSAPMKNWEAAAEAAKATHAIALPDNSMDDWRAFAKRTCVELEDGRVAYDYDPEIVRSVSEAEPDFKTRFAMWRLFGKMKKRPLLIIRGGTSDIIEPETVNLMCKRHKGAKAVTVPNVGHAPMLDEPVAVEAIGEFLETL